MRSCSFASVRSTVVVATLAFALSACLGGGSSGGGSPAVSTPTPTPPDAPGPSPQPGAEANPTAVERAVRRVAAHRDDETTGWHYSRVEPGSGSSYRAWSQSSSNEGARPGRSVYHAAPWRDEDGEVQFHILMDARKPFQRDPDIYAGRYISTHRDGEGATVTRSPLGADSVKPGWRGFRAASTLPGGGTLNVRYFTDATDGDFAALRETYDRNNEGFTRVIALDDPPVPARPADRSYFYVVVPDAGLSGTLDGEAGRFTCAGASCALAANVSTRGYYPQLGDVVFTPDDGSGAVTLTQRASASVPKVGYLSFGHWLYAPETLTDGDAWDFGVFAGGDDPFDTIRLWWLTGRADYAGAAAGVWASGEETIDFSADVALTAAFGNATEWGRIDGSVSGFALENGAAAPLSTLTLGSVSFRDNSGAHNIFPVNNTGGSPIPGGWVVGNTSGGDGAWSGVWGGQFFGNGASAADHPSAFAGTFGAVHASSGSLAGAFGAHKRSSSDPTDVERAVRRIAAQGDDGTTGWHYSRAEPGSGSSYRAWSQSSSNEGARPGRSVYHAAPWRDEDGEVQFLIAMDANKPLQRDPNIYAGRAVGTAFDGEGATVIRSPLRAGSVKPGWRGFQAASTLPGGGTLNVRYFTDATDDDFAALRETYGGGHRYSSFTRVIAMDDPQVPERPADRAYLLVVVPGAGLSGSLDGKAGRFTCAGAASSCSLETGVGSRGYVPRFGDVVFTPDDGSGAVTLTPGVSTSVPKRDYLSFGHWLYAPETLTDGDAWDFGVFAGGDDPFDAANLMPLTGRADYAGAAAGVWALGEETIDFSANVTLTAAFGSASEWGAISGSVGGFALESDNAAPLSALNLGSVSFRDGSGAQNIFPTYDSVASPIPGGWVVGNTSGGDGAWSGVWGGQFFGNGASATDHPSAFAGTFGAVHASSGSIAGAFGAHKQ